MNAYLTRLGIRPDIQEWLAPYSYLDGNGNLCFSYGDDAEVYGLAFHRVPHSGTWSAGPDYARQIMISSSVMELIAWLNCHLVNLQQLLFVAGNYHAIPRNKKYSFLFGNDLTGHLHDLKAAAYFHNYPIEISFADELIAVHFRNQCFAIDAEDFSLSAFERLSGFRFGVRTLKPSRHSSWLNQLLST